MLLIIRQRPLNKRASHMLSFNYFTRVFNKIKMHQDFDKSSDVEVGSIKSLTLSNFMCHEYFEIEFGPRVNFIVGKNGSKFLTLTFFYFYLLFFLLFLTLFPFLSLIVI